MADSISPTTKLNPAQAYLQRKKAKGEKVVNVWMYPEEIAKIDRIKEELGVRSRSDVFRRLIAERDRTEPEDESLSERAA